MKVEIAEHGRMSESGSSLLRLIQNQNMPLLDLLVRESTQNSLDASIKGKKYVNVDFNVGKFRSDSLNKHFDAISHSLNKRFPASNGLYDYIEVRDSNTYGLTGPVKYEDVKDNKFGNLLKLVYEICKPQQNEGAGGSWGLGKTIYFRVGIGLVIYYSRICQNGKYISRLAACLVEDETKTEALIPYYGGVKRGIAWWGQKDGKNKTIPLDNERAINDILAVFGIKPYQNDETGTTIIIPYINEKSLLSEVYANNEDQEYKPFWTTSVKEYLKAAIQRWYAPRLSNPYYPYGAYLSSSVCGEKIRVSNMLPLFRVIRELYILGQNVELDSEALLFDSKDKHIEKIELRGVFSERSISGNFAYVKLDKKQLLMEAPENNRSPYQQISNSFINMEGGNIPIVMYTRRPGMIVGYDFDGVWTHRMPKTTENEYVIGLFVLNSENRLKGIINNITGENLSLEEYIRQGEKADHASWTDRNINGNNPRIVSNIQKNIIRKITAKYNEKKIDTTIKRNLGLGHALANILLPSTDFGHTPHVPPTPPKPPVKPKPSKQHSSLSLLKVPNYENGKITLDFEMFIKASTCELKLFVLTDFKKYEADIWEDDAEIGTAFPLMVQSVIIESSRTKDKNSMKNHDLMVDEFNVSCSDEDFYLEIIESEKFNVKNAVKISSARNDTFVKGKFVFASTDSSIKGVLDIKEVHA